MIDPSSSEEESEEDQSTHHGGGGGGRGGSGSSHGSHHHPAGGPGSGTVSGSVGSLASGITASPGGSNHVGPAGGIGTQHGPARTAGTLSQDSGSALDVPSITSARNSLSPSMTATQDAANYSQRPTSPSPSVASEKTEVDLQVSI